jgi:hypothetical protein
MTRVQILQRAGAQCLLVGATLAPATARDTQSLSSRIQHLEDTEEIRTLLLNYGRYLDDILRPIPCCSPKTENGSVVSAR